MPTPARTSLDDIVQAGRDILASDGLPALTMQAVADRVGVRAPSLYKRVRSRDDLVRLIATTVAHELGDQLDALVSRDGATSDAQAQLTELAHAVRAFARARPDEYRLIFARPARRPDRSPKHSPTRSGLCCGSQRNSRDPTAHSTRPAPSPHGRPGSSAWSSPAPSASAVTLIAPTSSGITRLAAALASVPAGPA